MTRYVVISVGKLLNDNNPRPKISVEEEIYDFGSVEPGQRVNHEFIIKNIGNAPLVVEKIKTSCGCAGASIQNNVIQPNHKEKLSVWYKARKISGETTQWVALLTNIQEHPDIMLHLKANVVPKFQSDPSIMNFGILDKNQLPLTKKLRVMIDESQQDIDIKSFNATSDNSVTLNTKKLQSGIYEVFATIPKETPSGFISGNISLHLQGKDTLVVPMMGKIIGEFYAFPGELFWGKVKPGATEKKVKILSQQKSVASISVDVIGPIKTLISVEIDSVGNEKVLVVTMKPKTPLINSANKIQGIIQVAIIDELGKTYKLDIPATALYNTPQTP